MLVFLVDVLIKLFKDSNASFHFLMECLSLVCLTSQVNTMKTMSKDRSSILSLALLNHFRKLRMTHQLFVPSQVEATLIFAVLLAANC